MINRRRFIQASALLIAGTSTLALTGCGSPKTPEDVACAFVRALYPVSYTHLALYIPETCRR